MSAARASYSRWAFAVIAALVVAAAYEGLQHIPAPSSSSDWAAWVQSVGTVAAVLWAAWIYRQGEVVRRREALNHRENVGRAAAAAMKFAADQLVGLNALVSKPLTRRGTLSAVTFDRLAMADEMLSAVPIIDAEDSGATEALISTRSRIAQAVRRSTEYNHVLRSTTIKAPAILADLRRQMRVLLEKTLNDVVHLRERYPEVSPPLAGASLLNLRASRAPQRKDRVFGR